MKKIISLITIILSFALSAAYAADDSNVALEKIVVTASRMAQHDYKVSANVTVINREQIEASNAQTVPDILKEVMGTHVTNYSTAKTSALDIRGFGDTAARNILVLVNDRRLNTIDISSPDLLQIPLESVERIEIIRGAGSVLYGDNAVGGVVNIITKKGKGNLSGKIGSYIGSYDARGSDLEISGSKKNFSYFFYSKYADDRGYRQNSDVLSKDFNARLGYNLSDRLSIDFDASIHRDNYGLPGGLSEVNLSALGPRASTNLNDFASTKDDNFKLGFTLNPSPKDMYLGNIVVDLYLRDRDVFDSFSGFDTSRTIHTKGLTTKYIFDHTIFNKEFNFVTGIDYYDTDNDIIGSGSNSDNITISKTDIGVFGFAQYEMLDHLFFNAGTRYYKADYAFSQRNSVNVDEKQHPDKWVSMGGAKYEYAKGSNVHFNIQQTFRFLATDEWYDSFTGTLNTSLKHQSGIQYEVGLKHNFRDALTLSITPYWMDNKNEIFFDPTQGFFGANNNYDKTRRIGVEVGQELDILKFVDIGFLDKLKFTINYTYQDPKFNGGTSDGKTIPLVPHHQVGSGLVAHFLKNYQLSLVGDYVGPQYAINDTSNITTPIKSYYVMDSKLVYQKGNIEIYGAINNIFNQFYSSIATKSTTSTSKSFYPSPARNFSMGANLKF